ncbi:helicase-exonuclease AddAB subunit AddA [Lacticaseibacillus saniviri]|uniref:ATP-dependent helicase/nuclease subunit A n=1 Tax=Lacticaseibacillus saniviri JCM 17471 = DSM 24301 TaxID=1293598 RepID=A0A0R2N1E8_9LACO|nr:helicase-exonuclease AddAB subunit AddA [Lacticaseibacillus saniviri]KRO18208.1 ATP-dependent nuclease subunit A [Lacticaseibacillus saniviri JCM 17471 = DSM 24301]
MPKFTQSQQMAVEASGHDILVSASAGSGKTTVLVERIIQKILHGQDIRRLLIVTFTKAATEEMRQRIQKTIKTQLDEDASLTPAQRKHLNQQQAFVSTAPIHTLDAFNLQLVQRYYYLLDLDPQFRLLADEAERALIEEDVWDQVREAYYAGDRQADFETLTTVFSRDRDDLGLQQLVFRLLDFANINPDPLNWLKNIVVPYQQADYSQSEQFKQAFVPLFKQRLQDVASLFERAIALTNESALERWHEQLQADLALIKPWLSDEPKTYAQLAEIEMVGFARWPGAKKADELDDTQVAAKKQAQALRDQAKKLLDSNVVSLVALSEEDLANALTQAGPIVALLSEVTIEFNRAFQAEKNRRHLQDYGDLAHNALAILNQTDPATDQPLKESIRAGFDEVMIDEYQDINPLQEAMLDAVSQPDPGNRFMVGDVKQSIYAFRLANPKLFLEKYQRFADDSNAGQRIILAENFRSSRNVLDFTNLIFSQVMDQAVGDMAYDEAAELKLGAKDIPEDFAPTTQVLLYDDEAAKAGDKPALGKDRGQVQLVVQQIQQMMAEPAMLYDRKQQQLRPVTYGDITILTRSRSLNTVIQDEFAKAAIPLVLPDAKNYFKTTELQVMLSLLRVVDNPKQEIPLVAVLRSPIVGLTADQLTLIRLADRSQPYYDAVSAFLSQDESTLTPLGQETYHKLQRFMTQLNQFRELARNNQLVDLIWAIYAETGYLDFVGGMPGGPQRQANLRALYERAHTYEQNGFKGLFPFVHFVELMQRGDQDLAQPVVLDPNVNAVHVMTIHQSKGLEFPVVFLLNTSKRFNEQDTHQRIALTAQQIGIKWYDQATHMEFPLPQLELAKAELKQQLQAEEMRLLYVALTRAEQRLILVGAAAEKQREVWSDQADGQQTVLSPLVRSSGHSYLDWIGPSLMRHPDAQQPIQLLSRWASRHNDFNLQFSGEIAVQEASEPDIMPHDEAESIDLHTFFDYQYPHLAASQTTGFQAVSEIKRAFDDPDTIELTDQRLDYLQQHRYQSDFVTPAFLSEATTVSATAIGSATHLVLQEIDLTQPITADSVNQLVTQLATDGVIAPEVAAKIDQNQVLNFFTTPFGQLLIAHADDVQREVPFSMLLPASRLFAQMQNEDEQVLIHGIIDGYLTLPEGLILFDYKTDHNPEVETMLERYRGQLNLYAEALDHLTTQPVIQKKLVLLHNGSIIDI